MNGLLVIALTGDITTGSYHSKVLTPVRVITKGPFIGPPTSKVVGLGG